MYSSCIVTLFLVEGGGGGDVCPSEDSSSELESLVSSVDSSVDPTGSLLFFCFCSSSSEDVDSSSLSEELELSETVSLLNGAAFML